MPSNIDDVAIGVKHDPALTIGPDENFRKGSVAHEVELPPVYEGKGTLTTDMIGEDFPTEEEVATLHRVPGHIPWKAYTIAFVELCERFSYYGTTVVCKFLVIMSGFFVY
jgi:proton-dependent oligopeptide transporter, POT family